MQLYQVNSLFSNEDTLLLTNICLVITDGRSTSLTDVISVNATDADSGDNGKIKYSLVAPPAGFSIDADEGVLKANLSTIAANSLRDMEVTVKASDLGSPPLSSFASIRIQVNAVSGINSQTNKRDYK